MANVESNPNREQALRAQDILLERFRGRSWLRGIGILNPATGYAVQLNVDPDDENLKKSELPTECEGVPVEVVFIHAYYNRDSV